jgi:hypothetical protein
MLHKSLPHSNFVTKTNLQGQPRRVLSNDLWTEVRKQARASKSRKGDIAYVTRGLVGFRKGDTLVVDASDLAIRNGKPDTPSG